MNSKNTTLYLAIACGVVALVLIALYLSGGDPTLTGGGAVAVTMAVAEAARRQRKATREKVEKAKAEASQASDDIEANRDQAETEATRVAEDVAKMTDDDLKKEGEELFGPGNREDA